MKKWENPNLLELGVKLTNELYITECYWNGAESLGVGNEDYTDPNNKPEQHPDWVWCNVHGRWHPKDHTKPSQS